MRALRDRITDIIAAMTKTERAVSAGRDAFLADEMLQVWAIYHIQVIGEAVRAAASELQQRRPDLPWVQVIGMRNILVHDYFGIDMDEVWNVLIKDIPALRIAVEALLASLP